ncbi:VOC family protein [Motiliproteus sp. MSK22-1]|uniref:VOC family protein n=1 Tax=Motiliproteus sp. MSK22-1 TaxID=1897630 RepID=UPI00097649E0|nr:VOC family protein [Motiliproteus sp. MSK22-1]OMH30388.1 hypothetical protein BGP75_18600 [Motiliproteus sp. MSK22-1]
MNTHKPRSGISYITLSTVDFDSQLNFYQNGFGFPLKRLYQDPDRGLRSYAFFDLGPVTLALYPKAALSFDASVSLESNHASIALSHNTSSKDSVNQLMSGLEAAGATITQPAKTLPWGGYGGYLQDPEGNLWEIVWSPKH